LITLNYKQHSAAATATKCHNDSDNDGNSLASLTSSSYFQKVVISKALAAAGHVQGRRLNQTEKLRVRPENYQCRTFNDSHR